MPMCRWRIAGALHRWTVHQLAALLDQQKGSSERNPKVRRWSGAV
jgi:hypothetical protein